MNRNELAQIRNSLGKTQKQMGQLLGVSIRTIQSFEQGFRKVPVHIERHSLFLLSLKRARTGGRQPCWVARKCPETDKQNCPAWEFNAGLMCWLINGTICQGKVQKSWKRKMEICRKCSVFQSVL
jgi:hypothetical protein